MNCINYFVSTYSQNVVVMIAQLIWAIFLLLLQKDCRDNKGNKVLKVWILIITIFFNMFPYIGICFNIINTVCTLWLIGLGVSFESSKYYWKPSYKSKLMKFLMRDL